LVASLARILLHALINVDATVAFLRQPTAFAFLAALGARSRAFAVARDMTWRAEKLRFVLEGFIEAIAAGHAAIAGISFITATLAIALARSIAFADSVAATVLTLLAVFAELAGWTANLKRFNAEPLEKVWMLVLMLPPVLDVAFVLFG